MTLTRIFPDNTHLSQRRPIDVMLVRLRRPMDSPLFNVLVFGTGFEYGNVRLARIQFLFLVQPMGRLLDGGLRQL
ncbi:hypothetical protein OUZ56_009675 [Daphnia magna]|uniref:Uncharacterized protein n=1 Tax=Daphnia magna TaxID=35525 RepID=A0ABR0AGQ5_9CRUS|nr:hypothetical protein OUZ56_009675 [Daphnia magna]